MQAGPQLGPEELAKAKTQLMQQLPSAQEDIFKAHIDWALFDMARGQLVPRLSSFVDKKITEMLGEQETTLVRFPTPGQALCYLCTSWMGCSPPALHAVDTAVQK